VGDLGFERRTVAYSPAFTSAEQLRDYYKAYYGPTIAAYRGLSGDPERSAALDRDFLAFWERTGPPWQAEYLLVTARKR
jgi:hypothetical protein